VVVQLYAAESNGMLLIEQPEIHLHSKAQADLADLFIDAVGPENK
jgi:predicted ATPase